MKALFAFVLFLGLLVGSGYLALRFFSELSGVDMVAALHTVELRNVADIPVYLAIESVADEESDPQMRFLSSYAALRGASRVEAAPPVAV